MLNLGSMQYSHSHLYAHMKQVAYIDNCIGTPAIVTWEYKNHILQATPVLIRYMLEISYLEDVFGRYVIQSLVGGYDKHIIEIGGGYGGMSTTMQSIYGRTASVKSTNRCNGKYSIVDIEAAGRLQRRYVDTVSDILLSDSYLLNHELFEGYPIQSVWDTHIQNQAQEQGLETSSASALHCVDVNIIPSDITMHVASNLLMSIFALSELKKYVVDRYIQQYVTHAVCGYIQLNYGENNLYKDIKSIDQHSNIYSALEMFREIYTIYPNAVLLPPPIYYDSGPRIIWKNSEYC